MFSMKLKIQSVGSFAFFLGVFLIAGKSFLAQAAPILKLPSSPVNATFHFKDEGQDSFSYIFFSDLEAGYDVAAGINYLGWCVDGNTGPAPYDGISHPVTLYSSYDPNLPEGLKTYLGNPIPWDQVNWILNNKGTNPNTVINPAILYLILHQREFPHFPWSCPEGSPCDQLASQAKDKGTGFVPQPGQVVGVLLYSNGIAQTNDGFQENLIEVRIPVPETPAVDIRKQAEGPDSRSFTSGSDVSFQIVVTNTGGVALTGVAVTDVQAPGCAKVIGDLAPGGTTTYTCTVPQVTQGFENVACASGQAAGSSVQDCDSSTVTIEPVPQTHYLYIPALYKPPLRFDMVVGYEDLPFNNSFLDYDYNDFNVSIQTIFTLVPDNQDLQKVEFVITPRARGGTYNHAFHMLFPANSFASDGTVTLILKDQNGNPINVTTTPFLASQAKDFTIFPSTSDAFPSSKGVVNAIEGTPYMTSLRSAVLTFEFTTPKPVDLSHFNERLVEITHAAGLFFDPWLHVFNSGEDIHQGDHRVISAPGVDWMWPEEGVWIGRAYTAITGISPNEVFPTGWWSVHNNCVYGDGIKCP